MTSLKSAVSGSGVFTRRPSLVNSDTSLVQVVLPRVMKTQRLSPSIAAKGEADTSAVSPVNIVLAEASGVPRVHSLTTRG